MRFPSTTVRHVRIRPSRPPARGASRRSPRRSEDRPPVRRSAPRPAPSGHDPRYPERGERDTEADEYARLPKAELDLVRAGGRNTTRSAWSPRAMGTGRPLSQARDRGSNVSLSTRTAGSRVSVSSTTCAPHCVVQEMVILQDDVRDLLPALEEAQHEQIDRIEQVQMRLQEHRVVRAAARGTASPFRASRPTAAGCRASAGGGSTARSRDRNRRPDRVASPRTGSRCGQSFTVASTARARGDRQSLTHPWTEPAHRDRVRSQSARVA